MSIVVTGMHRSGTSMVASILQALGVNLGPDEELMPANQFNVAGYFENEPVVSLNEALAKKNGLTWRTLPALQQRKTIVGLDSYVSAAQEIVTKFSEKTPWAIKDPRLSFLVEHWKSIAAPLSVVICLRRPQAVALSLRARNELSLSYGAALWQLYTLAALRNSRRIPRTLVVYEQLLAKPRQAIEKLIAGIPELTKLDPDEAAINRAIACVRPELDHSESVNIKALPPGVLELYSQLAGGELSVSRGSEAAAVAQELVRLEAGHQSAKRLHTESVEQLAAAAKSLETEKSSLGRLTERLSDLVMLHEPENDPPREPDQLYDRLRRLTARIPTTSQQRLLDRAAEEMLRSKDEQIVWLRCELSSASGQARAELDQGNSVQVELARTRATHDQASSLRRDLEQSRNEASRLRLQADELRSELEHVRTVQKELERELEHSRSQVGQVQLEKDQLASAIATRDQNEQALRASVAQLETAGLEARQQLSLARTEINTLKTGYEEASRRMRSENDLLAQALENARRQVLELRNAPPGQTAIAPAPRPLSTVDSGRRRRLLVLNELLSSIDKLLSPPLGRFAIPVRQIRVKLSQARGALDDEIALART